ncbi:ABC transporter ATP-binding protein [Streptomyces sp. TG1A-8]|uniref:energy-coupling factor ABC transporter ATP-binding protein n=1 Tax=Streptomyces sp. TG1A-8 TaxID=3051385 RepID=UPI00265C0363|nr:ABC transporter ATP-binding protein [Streptomyces sp. TG1A-8]MDO0924232.1 ABC transporter ATP-binding protein [Streptomyces sp. TG1A-8]
MILRVDSLTHRYPGGTLALRDVSLQVRAGERVAVVGPNGAGKSTLARHLIGILRPTSGVVEVDGRSTEGLPVAALARTVGFVFQNPDNQLHARTVADEVAFGPRNLGFSAARRDELTAWALRVTGLSGNASDHPHHLSFSRRKRVALASVLAMDTPVLILDEPTINQDHRSLELLGTVVDELAARGKTLVAVTHDMDFCARHFDRVVVMHQGRVRWDGPFEQWLDDPEHAARAGELPQVTRLGRALGWNAPPATVDAFLDRLRARDGAA